MALRGAERWEIEIAISAVLERHRELACRVSAAAAAVCDMHGILDELDRRLVRDVAELRLALAQAVEGVAA